MNYKLVNGYVIILINNKIWKLMKYNIKYFEIFRFEIFILIRRFVILCGVG